MLWILAVYLPFVAAFYVLGKNLNPRMRQGACVIASLPALWLSLFVPEDGGIAFPWLIMGTGFGLDPMRQVFLFFTSVLWLTAGFYSGAYFEKDSRQRIFYFFYLLTMSGNFGLIIAEDIASFYTFFTLMTFAAYGLVIYDRTDQARRAGSIYILMAVFGEAFLLTAIFLAVDASGSTLMSEIRLGLADSPNINPIVVCTLIGFGVKAGALGIHMWLPLAHPVAPTPASAVLSGAMIKAGLLGWLNFLPLGEIALSSWGLFLILVGLSAAFYAVVVGLSQEEPKTNLAYSSVSQMGLITVAVGIGLAAPEALPLVLGVVSVHALGHGLAKGALFLGVGIASGAVDSWKKKVLTTAGLFLAALAIIGGPFTSGAAAKRGLKELAASAPNFSGSILDWALPLSAVGTTLLLGRFILLCWREMNGSSHGELSTGVWWGWLSLLSLAVFGAWFAVPYFSLAVGFPDMQTSETWESLWPALFGAALLLAAVRMFPERAFPYRIEAGDVVVVFEKLGAELSKAWQSAHGVRAEILHINLESHVRRFVQSRQIRRGVNRIEGALASWTIAGTIYVGLILVAMTLAYIL